MSTSFSVELTIAYQDYTERTYKLPTRTAQNAGTVKTKIQAFNTAAAISSSDVAKTFLSDNGAHPIGITEAEIVTVEEEVIYNG